MACSNKVSTRRPFIRFEREQGRFTPALLASGTLAVPCVEGVSEVTTGNKETKNIRMFNRDVTVVLPRTGAVPHLRVTFSQNKNPLEFGVVKDFFIDWFTNDTTNVATCYVDFLDIRKGCVVSSWVLKHCKIVSFNEPGATALGGSSDKLDKFFVDIQPALSVPLPIASRLIRPIVTL